MPQKGHPIREDRDGNPADRDRARQKSIGMQLSIICTLAVRKFP